MAKAVGIVELILVPGIGSLSHFISFLSRRHTWRRMHPVLAELGR